MHLHQPPVPRSSIRFTEPHEDVGSLDEGRGARNSDRLDIVLSLTQPSGISKQDRDTNERQWDIDMVASRSRDIGDNRPLYSGYSVDKTGLTSIRRASDDDANSVLQR